MAKSRTSSKPGERGSSSRSSKTPALQAQTKKQIALSRKQARQNRILWISLAVLGLLIVAILGVGLVREVWLKPATTVATVNGAKITLSDYLSTLNYQRYGLHRGMEELQYFLQTLDTSQAGNEALVGLYQGQITQYEEQLASASSTALDQLIEDRLIEEKALELDITVTPDEVDQFVDEQMRYLVAPSSQETITTTESSPTPTPIPQKDLKAAYDSFLEAQKLSDKAFRRIVESGLRRSYVQEALADSVPNTGLVLQVEMIQTASNEEATAARARIESGEEFPAVASEVSTAPGAAEDGGNLGTVAQGQYTVAYGQAWEDAVLAAGIGELVIVESEGSHYLIRVTQREEDGTLPEQVLSRRRSSALVDWLTQKLEDPSTVIVRDLKPELIPPDPF